MVVKIITIRGLKLVSEVSDSQTQSLCQGAAETELQTTYHFDEEHNCHSLENDTALRILH